jgi:hypothetical protein
MMAKVLVKAIALLGCSSLFTATECSPPKQYRLGERIPIGSYILSISKTEITHELHQRQLVVHYRCTASGSTALSQSERDDLFSACQSPNFSLLDNKSNDYAPSRVELTALYIGDKTAYQESYTNDEESRVINPAVEAKNKKEADVWAESAMHSSPEQWVVIFEVPEEATKFTLKLKPSLFESSDTAIIALDR